VAFVAIDMMQRLMSIQSFPIICNVTEKLH